MIKWEDFADKFLTKDGDGTYYISNNVNVEELWNWIIGGYYDGIKAMAINENQRWLDHVNRLGPTVPQSLRKVTKSDLKDRIEELSTPQIHHPFCNSQSGLVRQCKYCQTAFKEYPIEEGMSVDELVKKHFPDAIPR